MLKRKFTFCSAAHTHKASKVGGRAEREGMISFPSFCFVIFWYAASCAPFDLLPLELCVSAQQHWQNAWCFWRKNWEKLSRILIYPHHKLLSLLLLLFLLLLLIWKKEKQQNWIISTRSQQLSLFRIICLNCIRWKLFAVHSLTKWSERKIRCIFNI